MIPNPPHKTIFEIEFKISRPKIMNSTTDDWSETVTVEGVKCSEN